MLPGENIPNAIQLVYIKNQKFTITRNSLIAFLYATLFAKVSALRNTFLQLQLLFPYYAVAYIKNIEQVPSKSSI